VNADGLIGAILNDKSQASVWCMTDETRPECLRAALRLATLSTELDGPDGPPDGPRSRAVAAWSPATVAERAIIEEKGFRVFDRWGVAFQLRSFGDVELVNSAQVGGTSGWCLAKARVRPDQVESRGPESFNFCFVDLHARPVRPNAVRAARMALHAGETRFIVGNFGRTPEVIEELTKPTVIDNKSYAGATSEGRPLMQMFTMDDMNAPYPVAAYPAYVVVLGPVGKVTSCQFAPSWKPWGTLSEFDPR
jgi:hypothetical protein